MSQMNLLSIESSQPTEKIGVLSSGQDSSTGKDGKFSSLVDRHINDAQSGKQNNDSVKARGNYDRLEKTSADNDNAEKHISDTDHCHHGHADKSNESQGENSGDTTNGETAKNAVNSEQAHNSTANGKTEDSEQLLALLSSAGKMLNGEQQGDVDGENALNRQANLSTDGAKNSKTGSEATIGQQANPINKWGVGDKQAPGDSITPIKPVDNQNNFAHLMAGKNNHTAEGSDKALTADASIAESSTKTESSAKQLAQAALKGEQSATLEAKLKADAAQTEAAAKLLAQAQKLAGANGDAENNAKQGGQDKSLTQEINAALLKQQTANTNADAEQNADDQTKQKQAADILAQSAKATNNASEQSTGKQNADKAVAEFAEKSAQLEAKIAQQLAPSYPEPVKPVLEDTIQPINPANLTANKTSENQNAGQLTAEQKQLSAEQLAAAAMNDNKNSAVVNGGRDNAVNVSTQAAQRHMTQQNMAQQGIAEQVIDEAMAEEALSDEALQALASKDQLLASSDKSRLDAQASERVAQTVEQNRNTKAPVTPAAPINGLTTEQRMAAEHQAALQSIENVASLEKTQAQKSIQVMQTETIAIYRKDFANAVKDKVMVMVNQKLQQLDIQLDPPELGNVHVRVNLQGEQAQVNFVVQNQQAKEAFEQSTDKLREMLAESGVDVGDTNVSQGSEQNADNDGAANENGQFAGQAQEAEDQQTMVLDGKSIKASANGIDYYA